MSKLGREKIEFLFDIIEKTIGKIDTSESRYKESLNSLDDYEFICNCCLEIFQENLKYEKSHYYSTKEVGKRAKQYLVELKDWITDVLEEE